MKTKVEVAGVEISSPDKMLFPKDKITKLDVARYYEKIAPRMLPYISDRLLSVIRCHESIDGEKFFKKHPTTEGEFVSKFLVGDDEFFYVKNKAELVFQAQMGTLEFHTWGSRIKNIEKPDLMVFDLDPSEKLPLDRLCEGVQNLKNVLDELQLKSYLKTSGGKGYHVVVPFSKSKDWDSFANFSKQIALLLESKWPKLFTTNIRKDERHNKIFVDYLRNKKTATCVAPYSLRARSGAPISFPIKWEDLGKIAPNEITIKNVGQHIKAADPWDNIFQEKQILR